MDISWSLALAGIILVQIGMLGEWLKNNATVNSTLLTFSQKMICDGCDKLRRAGFQNKALFFEERHDKKFATVAEKINPIVKTITDTNDHRVKTLTK